MVNLKKYQWKYRILLIQTPNYNNENYIHTKNIYENNIKEFHKRYIKLITSRKKEHKFNILLYGFDGNEKYNSKKLNINKLFTLVDNMPLSKENFTPKNLSLYSDYNKDTTIKGLGFKNKEKAIYTLKKIKNKSLTYQKSVVNTMIERAKHHPYQTNDMIDAIKVFEEWKKNIKNTI